MKANIGQIVKQLVCLVLALYKRNSLPLWPVGAFTLLFRLRLLQA